MTAYHALNVNALINVQGNSGRVVINTGFDPTFTTLALLNFNATGAIKYGTVDQFGTAIPTTNTAGRLAINGAEYTLVTSVNNVIPNNNNGKYALANDIRVGSPWNISGFTGTFEGLGNVWSQYGGTSANDSSLFDSVGSGGVVRDLILQTQSRSGSGSQVFGNAFIGANQGILANVALYACDNCSSGSQFTVASGSGVLVGTQTGGLITNSYAIGFIASGTGAGLVGTLSGATLRDSFFLGTVQNGGAGLVGTATNSTILNSFTNANGGLAGSATNTTFTNSYYDTSTNLGSAPFGTGRTTAQLQAALPAGFSSATWGIIAGYSYPYLLSQASVTGPPKVFSGTAYTDAGATPAVDLAVQLQLVDSFLQTKTHKNGYYYFLVPRELVPNGSNVFTMNRVTEVINFNNRQVTKSANIALNVTANAINGMDLWANTFGVSTSAALLSQVNTAAAISAFNAAVQYQGGSIPVCCLITAGGNFTLDQATS